MAKTKRKKKQKNNLAKAVPYVFDFSPVDPYYLYDLNGTLTIVGNDLTGGTVSVRFWNRMLPTGNYTAANIIFSDPNCIVCRRFLDDKALKKAKTKKVNQLKAPTCDEIEVTVTNANGQHSSKRKPIIL